MSTTQDQIHADAMQQSAAYYDFIAHKTTPPPLFTVSSLSPSWAIEGSISGGIWGPRTEFTDYAEAVSESYGLKPRRRILKYPGSGAGIEDPNFLFQTEVDELKSPVFRIRDIPEDCSLGSFAIPREEKVTDEDMEDEERDFEKEAKETDEEDDDEELESPYEADVFEIEAEHTGIEEDDEIPDRQDAMITKIPNLDDYRLVSPEQLSKRYAAYVSEENKTAVEGDLVTADMVMDDIINFVKRKIKRGTNDFGLLQRGENILGVFWKRIDKAVRTKAFEASEGKTFAHYVNKAWANHRRTAYKELNKRDERFESCAFWEDDSDESEDGQRMGVSQDDQYAFAVHDASVRLPTRENQIRCHELLADLNASDRALFEELMAAEFGTKADLRVKMSRHQKYRAKKRLASKLRRIDLRRESKTVAR